MSWVRFSRFGLVVLAGSRASDQEEEAGVRQCPWVVGCNTCTAPALSLVFRLLPTSGQCPPFCYRHRWVGAAPCYRHRWVGAPRFSRATAISGRCRFFFSLFSAGDTQSALLKILFCVVFVCAFHTPPDLASRHEQHTAAPLLSPPGASVGFDRSLVSSHPRTWLVFVVRSHAVFGPLPFFSFSSSG